MLKLVTWACVIGAAGLMLVGGCTPQADQTWSESADWTGYAVSDWSGHYSVVSDLDGRLTSMSLYQTGDNLQGYDNMRRSWFGTIVPAFTPHVNMETNDGPGGTEVIVGNAEILSTMAGDFLYIVGQHWASPATGTIAMTGPAVEIAQ